MKEQIGAWLVILSVGAASAGVIVANTAGSLAHPTIAILVPYFLLGAGIIMLR